MKWTNILLPAIGVFFLQLFLVELLSIRGIRPDFLLIFILYMSVARGSFIGIIMGFILGLFSDFAGMGTSFGLSPLTYVLSGYLAGFLSKRYEQMIPAYFHLTWIGIVLIHFLIFSYIQYQVLFNIDLLSWIKQYLLVSAYTLGFIWILQYIFPFIRDE